MLLYMLCLIWKFIRKECIKFLCQYIFNRHKTIKYKISAIRIFKFEELLYLTNYLNHNCFLNEGYSVQDFSNWWNVKLFLTNKILHRVRDLIPNKTARIWIIIYFTHWSLKKLKYLLIFLNNLFKYLYCYIIFI